MTFDTKKLKAESRKDWRRAWTESKKLVPGGTHTEYKAGNGSAHPIQDLVQRVRGVFLGMGFDEIENPLMISEDDVFRQYGPEAPVILDRVYYLAGLPRPDIGLPDDKIDEVRKISASANAGELKKILREYREGEVEGDNLLEEMVGRLSIKTDEAAAIISLFPEFKNIRPVAGKTTLRSHMTGAWFPTIAALYGKRELPMLLFSVGLRFRREQKVDSRHLRAHYGASMVVVDDNASVEAGKKLTEEILRRLDFRDVRFVKKKATSNYYAPDTEYEVFSGDIEVADIGMYSPVALANYDVPVNVFNLGFGLERFIMAKEKLADVRQLLYPQFYGAVDLTDDEVAAQVTVDKKPSDEYAGLVEALASTAARIADNEAPYWEAVDDDSLKIGIKVEVGEIEDGKRVLGPAALNRVYVYGGEIIAVPPKGSGKRASSKKLDNELSGIEEKGVDTGLTILDAASNYFAYEIEKRVAAGERKGELSVGMAKGPSDVNIKVGEQARRFIESNNRRIFIKGPVFMNVRFSVTGV